MKLENIVITAQSYKCGCGKGMYAVKEKGILGKLNSLINWSSCIWPEKVDMETVEIDGKEEQREKRTPLPDFLGNPPQLKPGNCFSWEKNIMAVEGEDDLVLIISETGPLAIKRFIAHVNNIEHFNNLPGLEKIEEVQLNKPEEGIESVRLKWEKWEVLKNYYKEEKEISIKVTDSERLLYPIVVWIDRRDLYYNPIDITEKELVQDELADQIYSWLIKKEEGN